MGDIGSITLNSKPYRIYMDSFRGRDLTDFSPRASTPGGGVVFNEMGLYQPLNQTDWRHGFGFDWHTDASGYWATEGNIETRWNGHISLGSRLIGTNTSSVSFQRIWEGCKGCYLAVDDDTGGLYNYSQPVVFSGTETLTALPFTGMTVVDVWSNGLYDFILANGQRLIRIASLTPVVANGTATGGGASTVIDVGAGYTTNQYTGYMIQLTGGPGSGDIRWITTIDQATQTITVSAAFSATPTSSTTYKIWDIHQTGTNANSADYSWMVHHDGFVYAGKDDTNQVYFGSADDLSDLCGAVADTTPLYVGKVGTETYGAISYNGSLIIFKGDGLYKMEADRKLAKKIVDYSDQSNSAYTTRNFTAWTVFNGTLVYGLYGHVYQWNGVRVSEITPPIVTDTFPYFKYYEYYSFVAVGNYLFMIATGGGSIKEDLICYDGVGWHKMCTLWSNTANSNYGADRRFSMIYRAYYSSLTIAYWQVDLVDNFCLQRFFMGPYGLPEGVIPIQLTGTNTWISSRFDAGFRRIQKSTPSVLITCSNLSVGHKYVDVYYRLNDGSWTAWGGTDGTTNRITTSGVTELKNPLGASSPASSTIEYYWLQLKIKFVSDISVDSPVVEDITIRLIMRPDTDYGYSFDIVGAKNTEYAMHQADERDQYTMLSDLRTCRDSKSPVIFVDPYGISHKVYVSSISESAVEEHTDDPGAHPNIEQIITCNVVSVEI